MNAEGASSDSTGNSTVIELSIEETNALRKQLGLTPLRLNHHDAPSNNNNTIMKEVTERNIQENKKNEIEQNSHINISSSNNKDFVEVLSIDETNELRKQLGLAPLRISTSTAATTAMGSSYTTNDDDPQEHSSSNSSSQKIIYQPATNERIVQEEQERIERQQLQQIVQQNIQTQFTITPSLGTSSTTTTKSWVQQMRKGQQQQQKASSSSTTKTDKTNTNEYKEQDLHGLHVGHAISEFEDGSTTILTLADTSLLKVQEDDNDPSLATSMPKKIIGLNDDDDDNDNDNNKTGKSTTATIQLQNVNMIQEQQVQSGLREKRKMELGHSASNNGYNIGYDDDEFIELGGVHGPSNTSRQQHHSKNRQQRGFQIGAMLDEQDADMESDLVQTKKNKAISLVSSSSTTTNNNNKSTMIETITASDFMTTEEYEQEEQERLLAKKKSKKSDKKMKKNKHSNSKKNRRRTTEEEDDDDDADAIEKETNQKESTSEQDIKKLNASTTISGTSFLDELESTATATGPTRRKRHRDDDNDENMQYNTKNESSSSASKFSKPLDVVSSNASDGIQTTNDTTSTNNNDKNRSESLSSKRARYEQVMSKGNERSQQIFGASTTTSNNIRITKGADDNHLDIIDDDAFLNAALEKARRLNRLKALQQQKSSSHHDTLSVTTSMKGAEAVVAALATATKTLPSNGPGSGGGTITFAVDETREFTRTLLARTEQIEREQARKAKALAMKNESNVTETSNKGTNPASSVADENMDTTDDHVDDDGDIQELAKQVTVEDNLQHDIAADGTTRTRKSGSMNRGVGNLLQLLHQTGSLSKKDGIKEEMRGRSKDKRPYEFYEPMDLSKVVKIDSKYATAKDKELASREVKLEYRDSHARLLTPKEAFRDLSYKFHGYGSGKRKQEKKLEQIKREQAEARLAAASSTTFHALKETQKATGKAYVVHKTGM